MVTPRPRGPIRPAFTLIELLVVISVILILMALLIPTIRMMHNQAYKNHALNLVNDLGNACDEYRVEDPRHLYPTPPMPNQTAANVLAYNTANAGLVLTLLQNFSTLKVDTSNIDSNPNSPTYNCMVDKWGRPIYYQIDGGYMSGSGPYTLDTHLMNGVADRPVASVGATSAGIAPGWNPESVEPYAYIWSCGVPSSNGDAADEAPTNWANWIYRQTSQ